MLTKTKGTETTIDRINYAIGVMKEVPDDQFNIISITHECGSPSCFAGYMYASKEGQAHQLRWSGDLIKFLGLSAKWVYKLCWLGNDSINFYESADSTDPADIKPCHVIAKLEEIRGRVKRGEIPNLMMVT